MFRKLKQNMLIDRNNMHNVRLKFKILIKRIQLELRQQLQCCREPDVWVWRDDAYWHEKELFGWFSDYFRMLGAKFYCKHHDPHVIG